MSVFSLFQIVTFPNSECTASTGATGTCVSRSECQGRGGAISGQQRSHHQSLSPLKLVVTGTCAMGFGACCLLIHSSCGGSLPYNCTYLRWMK